MIITSSLMTINTTKRNFCYATTELTNGDSKLSETTETICQQTRNNKPKDGKLSTPLWVPGIRRWAVSLPSPRLRGNTYFSFVVRASIHSGVKSLGCAWRQNSNRRALAHECKTRRSGNTTRPPREHAVSMLQYCSLLHGENMQQKGKQCW